MTPWWCNSNNLVFWSFLFRLVQTPTVATAAVKGRTRPGWKRWVALKCDCENELYKLKIKALLKTLSWFRKPEKWGLHVQRVKRIKVPRKPYRGGSHVMLWGNNNNNNNKAALNWEQPPRQKCEAPLYHVGVSSREWHKRKWALCSLRAGRLTTSDRDIRRRGSGELDVGLRHGSTEAHSSWWKGML